MKLPDRLDHALQRFQDESVLAYFLDLSITADLAHTVIRSRTDLAMELLLAQLANRNKITVRQLRDVTSIDQNRLRNALQQYKEHDFHMHEFCDMLEGVVRKKLNPQLLFSSIAHELFRPTKPLDNGRV
jgi:hypothetical protein